MVSDYLQYIALALGILLAVVFVRQIAGVLLTFGMAAILAYVLNPAVRRLEGTGAPRSVAVLGVFAVLGAVLTVGLLLLVVPAVRQVQTLIANPQVLVDGAAQLVDGARALPFVGEQVASLDQQRLTQMLRQNAPSAQSAFSASSGLVGGVFGVFGTILNLFLMVIVSIYLLIDRERITGAALSAIPATVRDQTVELFGVVESRLGWFLKGQLLLCAIMGVVGWAIVQFTIGQYAIVLGLWVAVTEFIPVIGAFLGAIPAVAIATSRRRSTSSPGARSRSTRPCRRRRRLTPLTALAACRATRCLRHLRFRATAAACKVKTGKPEIGPPETNAKGATG